MTGVRLNNIQQGFTLIEVLVTVLILAIGLLGAAGMHSRMLNGQFEAYQRATASLLVGDMANRVRSSPLAARLGGYGGVTIYGLADQNCAGLSGVDADKCEWNQALRGAGVVEGAQQLGSIIGARGCIDNVSIGATSQATIRVTVAWQGLAATVAPASACGAGAYGADDRFRRTASVDITLAYLGI